MKIILFIFFFTIRPALAEHTDTFLDLTNVSPTHETTLLVRRDIPLSFTSRVVSREQWGADPSFLFQQRESPQKHSDRVVQRKESSDREKDCDTLQNDFPTEFVAARTIGNDPQGRRYRWALQYSSDIQLLVVHHTALEVNGETRTEEERVRALYTYHANSLGWGDIGYNFVIGESGRIYEGRVGGDYAVGGHAYCYNVGSLGIALLGNFEQEKPSQEQIQGLQWLLDDLTKKYGIDPNGRVRFHGKDISTIVGHNDLNSTVCPGYFLDGVLSQIRSHVARGTLTTGVTFPAIRITQHLTERADARKKIRSGSIETVPQPRYSRRTTRSRRMVARAVERVTRDTTASPQPVITTNKKLPPSIRIRLSYTAQAATLAAPTIGEVLLKNENDSCNIPHVDAGEGIITITSWDRRANQFRGVIECRVIDNRLTLINALPLEDYLKGLAEEPDTEPYEKQRAFAIAARSYAAFYMESLNRPSSRAELATGHRKFPGMPYDGSDDPGEFQAYGGVAFERKNPQWVQAVQRTTSQVLKKNGGIVKAAYFSTDDGRTRTPLERGWMNFPFAEVFISKPDPWCQGLPLKGHGVGMSGCGARGQVEEGRTAEQILRYYYPGTSISPLSSTY
ncbi:N-acetylmuramoyl-L-alanine amidase [Candidatus Peregrinibacteria bacterium]|nr:N-acetylmuramoyl-L-alanine amidase [Candidatus Peregrinibacteria bacterium]